MRHLISIAILITVILHKNGSYILMVDQALAALVFVNLYYAWTNSDD